MWISLLKFIAIMFLKNKMGFIRSQFFNILNANNSDNLNQLKLDEFKLSIAAMAESRAALFKQNFNYEVQRVVNSLFGFMLILLAAILSLLAYLVQFAWLCL